MTEHTSSSPEPKKTLGLTGLTSNAMALIAPGAFLWLTYGEQSLYGAPAAGMSMWIGIVFALALCLATAIAYAELSKLYPGAGSSYFFAEQAFLNKKKAFRFARLSKFVVGWASHLYYWVYPGLMVGVTAIVAGYMIAQVDAHFSTGLHFNAAIPSPIFMYLFCIVFALGVSYIAYIGIVGSTSVGVVINITQIIALLVFSFMAISHRHAHAEGSPVWVFNSSNVPTQYVQDTMDDPSNPAKMIPDPANPGKTIQDPATGIKIPKVDANNHEIDVMVAADASGKVINDPAGNPIIVPTDATGKPLLPATVAKAVPQMVTVSYKGGITTDPATGVESSFNNHESAASVVVPHRWNYVVIQACIAILILVGFESVTSMGEEARNAKRDIPKAVILALVIQGGFCYLLEYFGANYFLHNGYTSTTAGGSPAPIGDMMQLIGAWAFGSADAGWWFMMIEAITVLLALIGTTLACINTGARVTYAMGRDEEMGSHFGLLHGKNATPHRAIWTLAVISAVIGIISVAFYFCGPAAASDATTAALPQNFWYKIGIFHNHDFAAKIPQSVLVVTLVSNFGTFLLYMMTCFVALVAFHEHHMHGIIKHKLIPIFGLLANLLCMVFYLVGPIPNWKYSVPNMSWHEPYAALAVAAAWGIYGAMYFLIGSKKTGKSVIITTPPGASMA